MIGLRPYELTPLEVASGLVFGLAPPRPLPTEIAGEPIDAFERAILPALQRPPCVVSFSGGRDSSAALAVAVRVARREGLPLPIPSTNRFPAVKDSHESDWQERVVAHLGIDDWLRPEFTDELDCVGPIATSVLRRYGLLWPFNAHFHVPHLEAAAGGSLLTGIGGDEILSSSSWARSERSFPAARGPSCATSCARASSPLLNQFGGPCCADVHRSSIRGFGPRRTALCSRLGRAWGVRAVFLGGAVRLASAFPIPPRRPREPGVARRRRLGPDRAPIHRRGVLGCAWAAPEAAPAHGPHGRDAPPASATSCPTMCSPARPSPASTRPSGATGAAPSPRIGAAREPTPSSSTSRRFGRNGGLRTPIRALSRSCKPHGWPKTSRIRTHCELVLRPVSPRSQWSYRSSRSSGDTHAD